MINDRFVVTKDQLNTTNNNYVETVKVTTTPSYEANNLKESINNFPVKIQFVNKSGVDVLVNILSSEEEYDAFVASPDDFSYFTVITGAVTTLSSSTILPQAHTIVVKSITDEATADFVIECIQYLPRR